LEKQSGVRNPPMPRSEFGPVAEPTVMGVRTIHDPNSVPGVEMGPGILNSNSTPWTKDSHQNQKHSNNLAHPAPEKSREAYADEVRRRLHDPARSTKYR
jgi:hypothetical protein